MAKWQDDPVIDVIDEPVERPPWASDPIIEEPVAKPAGPRLSPKQAGERARKMLQYAASKGITFGEANQEVSAAAATEPEVETADALARMRAPLWVPEPVPGAGLTKLKTEPEYRLEVRDVEFTDEGPKPVWHPTPGVSAETPWDAPSRGPRGEPVRLAVAEVIKAIHDRSPVRQAWSKEQIGVVEAARRRGVVLTAVDIVPFVSTAYNIDFLANLQATIQRLQDPERSYTTEGLARARQEQVGPIGGYLGLLRGVQPLYIDQLAPSELRAIDEAEAEQFILEQAELQRRGLSVPAQIVEGVKVLIPYMVEFYLTSGLAAQASAGTKAAIGSLAARYAPRLAKSAAVRAAGGLGTLAAQAGVRLVTIGVPHVLEEMLERTRARGLKFTPEGRLVAEEAGEKPFTAFAHSLASVFIEYFSEETGELITRGMAAPLKRIPGLKKAVRPLAEAMRRLAARTPGGVQRFFTKVAYSNFIGEMGEEALGRTLLAALNIPPPGADESGENVLVRLWQAIYPGWQQLLVEAGVLAVPGVTRAAIAWAPRPGEPLPPAEVPPAAPEAPPAPPAPAEVPGVAPAPQVAPEAPVEPPVAAEEAEVAPQLKPEVPRSPQEASALMRVALEADAEAQAAEMPERGPVVSFEALNRETLDLFERNPNVGRSLIAELENRPRQTTLRERAVLLHEYRRLRNQEHALLQDRQDALQAGDNEQVERLRVRHRALVDEQSRVRAVAASTITESAQALRYQRLFMAMDYTSAPDQIARLEASKGRPATPKEVARIVHQTEAVAVLNDSIEEARKQAEAWYREEVGEAEEVPFEIRVAKAPEMLTPQQARIESYFRNLEPQDRIRALKRMPGPYGGTLAKTLGVGKAVKAAGAAQKKLKSDEAVGKKKVEKTKEVYPDALVGAEATTADEASLLGILGPKGRVVYGKDVEHGTEIAEQIEGKSLAIRRHFTKAEGTTLEDLQMAWSEQRGIPAKDAPSLSEVFNRLIGEIETTEAAKAAGKVPVEQQLRDLARAVPEDVGADLLAQADLIADDTAAKWQADDAVLEAAMPYLVAEEMVELVSVEVTRRGAPALEVAPEAIRAPAIGKPARRRRPRAKAKGVPRIFTNEAAAAAKKRIAARLGRLQVGFDPTMLSDLVTIGGNYVESGIRTFGAWSKTMIEDFGDTVQPYLQQAWLQIQDRLEAEGKPDKARTAYKKRVQKRIDELQKKLEAGEITEPVRLPPRPLSAGETQLRNELGSLQRQMDSARLTSGEKFLRIAVEAGNIPRTLLTSFWDLSGMFRQGRMLMQRWPKLAPRFLKNYGLAFASEDFALALEDDYTSDPDLPRWRGLGLEISELASPLAAPAELEERYMAAPLLERIPVLGKYAIRPTERSFTASLNWYRHAIARRMVSGAEAAGKPLSDHDLRILFSDINDLSGRASVGRGLKNLTPFINVLFAPRWAISRVKVAYKPAVELGRMGYQIVKGKPITMPNTIVSWATLITTNLLIIGLIKWLYPDAETEPDLRATDGGKVKIGPMRIDLWAGNLPYMRTAARLISGKMKTAGGKLVDTDYEREILNVVRGRLNPLYSLLYDAIEGNTYIGEEFGAPPTGRVGKFLTEKEIPDWAQGVSKETWNRLGPLTMQDFVDTWAEMGVPAAVSAAMLSGTGMSVVTYPERAGTALTKLKDRFAQEDYGKRWEDLGPMQAAELAAEHWSELAEAKLKIDVERGNATDYAYTAKILEKERDAGKAVVKRLKQELRQAFKDYGAWFSLSRQFGDWPLNDNRYTAYQEAMAKHLAEEVGALLATPGWAEADKLVKQNLLRGAVSAAKALSLKEVVTQALQEEKER